MSADEEGAERSAVLAVLGEAGCMTPAAIAEGLTEEEDWSSRDAKLAVSSAIVDGDLEEHPQFEGHYRHA
jgi:hypothetical protein